jgi:tRNA modification GTPase
MITSEQTIAAIATATGGAISVIRISGNQALEIADRIFFKRNGQTLSQADGYTVHYGNIEYEGEVIDNALAVVVRAPHSYTGEDSVEFSCHGSRYIAERTIEALIANGARAATQGEFTKRAFLNGKMDLSQAEAVADIIASDSKAFHQVAMNQMKGSYSSGINTLREHLVELAALLELELDFSEEEVEFADRSKLRLIMQQLKSEINTMCQSFRSGNALKEGIPVAIVGAPNVGKSTLLNALVGEQRAIISDIAGTTRDTIEEVLFINGVKFRIIDTAGIRSSEDVIESMGIERSKKAVERAEIVVIVCDGNSVEIPEDLSLEQKRVIVVFNKRDINTDPVAPYQGEQVMISAKENQGTDELRRLLSRPYQDVCNQAVTVTNARHYEVLQRSEAELAIAEQALDNGLSADLVVEHIRVIINNLGEITGEITSDEILGTIFAKFCIGK